MLIPFIRVYALFMLLCTQQVLYILNAMWGILCFDWEDMNSNEGHKSAFERLDNKPLTFMQEECSTNVTKTTHNPSEIFQNISGLYLDHVTPY